MANIQYHLLIGGALIGGISMVKSDKSYIVGLSFFTDLHQRFADYILWTYVHFKGHRSKALIFLFSSLGYVIHSHTQIISFNNSLRAFCHSPAVLYPLLEEQWSTHLTFNA